MEQAIITTDNCMNHKVVDIKESELYENLPNKSRYKSKGDLCAGIKLYYKDTLGISSLQNQIQNPQLLEGINKYNLPIVYPIESVLQNKYPQYSTNIATYDELKQKYDDDILYLITFLDEFWTIVKKSNGNNEILKYELSQLPFYIVLMYYITYNMYFDTIRDALINEDMNVEIDDTYNLNDVIRYVISKGIDTVDVILRRYNFIQRIEDLDEYDIVGIDMSIFYENNNDIGTNEDFFNIDNLIIDGIQFKDGVKLASLSNRVSTKLDVVYYDNDIKRIDNIIKKYEFNVSINDVIQTYNAIYNLAYKIVYLLKLAQLTDKYLDNSLINI